MKIFPQVNRNFQLAIEPVELAARLAEQLAPLHRINLLGFSNSPWTGTVSERGGSMHESYSSIWKPTTIHFRITMPGSGSAVDSTTIAGSNFKYIIVVSALFGILSLVGFAWNLLHGQFVWQFVVVMLFPFIAWRLVRALMIFHTNNWIAFVRSLAKCA